MGTTNNLETQANGRIMTIILGKPSIRLIPCSSQLEKIWWSYIAKGIFSIHEAYHLELGHQELPTNEVCVKIRNHHIWPNISFFLWLLIYNITLTWDKIKKCNYQGPARWNFRILHLEIIKHLFNIISFSSCLWAHRDSFFSHSNRYPLNISNTTSNWKNVLSQILSLIEFGHSPIVSFSNWFGNNTTGEYSRGPLCPWTLCGTLLLPTSRKPFSPYLFHPLIGKIMIKKIVFFIMGILLLMPLSLIQPSSPPIFLIFPLYGPRSPLLFPQTEYLWCIERESEPKWIHCYIQR